MPVHLNLYLGLWQRLNEKAYPSDTKPSAPLAHSQEHAVPFFILLFVLSLTLCLCSFSLSIHFVSFKDPFFLPLPALHPTRCLCSIHPTRHSHREQSHPSLRLPSSLSNLILSRLIHHPQVRSCDTQSLLPISALPSPFLTSFLFPLTLLLLNRFVWDKDLGWHTLELPSHQGSTMADR